MFGEGAYLVSEWIVQCLGFARLQRRHRCISSASRFGGKGAWSLFGSPVAPSAGAVNRVAGVGGGARTRAARGCVPDRALPRAAEWKHAAASGCDARACGGGGAASGGGGGQGCGVPGEAGGG